LPEGAGPKADALSEKRFDANASQPNSFVEKFDSRALALLGRARVV